MVFILLISFTGETATPLFRDYNSFSLLTGTQDTDEKKDNEKKEEEIKDKHLSNANLFSSIEMLTDFYLKNDLVNTLGFLSLHEMPPDQLLYPS